MSKKTPVRTLIDSQHVKESERLLKYPRQCFCHICHSETKSAGKAGLLKCPKRCASEHLRKVNILKGPQHCITPDGSIFFILSDHSERKSARKTLFY